MDGGWTDGRITDGRMEDGRMDGQKDNGGTEGLEERQTDMAFL